MTTANVISYLAPLITNKILVKSFWLEKRTCCNTARQRRSSRRKHAHRTKLASPAGDIFFVADGHSRWSITENKKREKSRRQWLISEFELGVHYVMLRSKAERIRIWLEHPRYTRKTPRKYRRLFDMVIHVYRILAKRNRKTQPKNWKLHDLQFKL